MKKEGAIYWNKSAQKRIAGNGNASRKKVNKTPQWFGFTIVVLITFMICLAINFRAFAEMRRQNNEQTVLSTEIQKMKTTNVSLQEEIQNLKNDDDTIAREARKIGMSRSNEKVLVPLK